MQRVLRDSCIDLCSHGFSYSTFWYGELDEANYFIEAVRLSQKRKIVEENRLAHRIGIYMREASASVWNKNAHYPEEPHKIEFKGEKEEAVTPLTPAEMQEASDRAFYEVMSGLKV